MPRLSLFAFCGAEGNRTPDLLSAIQALSQLSYSPVPFRYAGDGGALRGSANAVWPRIRYVGIVHDHAAMRKGGAQRSGIVGAQRAGARSRSTFATRGALATKSARAGSAGILAGMAVGPANARASPDRSTAVWQSGVLLCGRATCERRARLVTPFETGDVVRDGSISWSNRLAGWKPALPARARLTRGRRVEQACPGPKRAPGAHGSRRTRLPAHTPRWSASRQFTALRPIGCAQGGTGVQSP